VAARLRLRTIVDGMDCQSDDMSFYLHLNTGEVVTVGEEEL